MTDAPSTDNDEKARIAALYRYGILDTATEAIFDSVTAAASSICETPIALISLVDPERQWFKSRVGLDVSETPRDLAFCAHAIKDPDRLTEIRDACEDERFKDNPLVVGDPKIRFYAGQPLCTSDGFALGTLCVIDSQPKSLTPSQRETLKHLANMVMALFEEKISSPTVVIGRAIEENLPNGVLITDAEDPANPITFCNVGFEKMTGYSLGEIKGKNCSFLQGHGTDKNTLQAIRKALDDGEAFTAVLKNYRKDGSEFWNELTLTPVAGSSGNPTHYIGFQDDVSRRIDAQLALEHGNEVLQRSLSLHDEVGRELADSNEALKKEIQQRKKSELQSLKLQDELVHIGRLSTMGEMATGLAHELNQPLLAVSQSADTALLVAMECSDSDPELIECLRDIQSETQRAGEIIRALRQFISRDVSNRCAVNINNLVEQTARLIESDARVHNIDLKLVRGEISSAFVDRVQIAQVLVNLLRNSVDAISSVKVNNKEQTNSVTIETSMTGEVILVTVTDTGPGFKSGIEPFKAFETTKGNGLGIGLSISRSIIESHNGRLWLDNNNSSGCTMQLTLPVAI